MESNLFCNCTSDQQNQTNVKQECNLLISSIIIDCFGHLKVLLPVNQTMTKFEKSSSNGYTYQAK